MKTQNLNIQQHEPSFLPTEATKGKRLKSIGHGKFNQNKKYQAPKLC